MAKALKWTARQTMLLKKEYPMSNDLRGLAKRLGRSYKALKSRAKVLNLRRKRQGGSPWTPALEKKLIKLYATTKNADIAKKLGIRASQIDNKAFKLRLFKDPEHKLMWSSPGCFKKGSVPANKGRKQTDYMSRSQIKKTVATRFKKGGLPPTTLYDGAITIRHAHKDRGAKPTKYIRLAKAKWQELQRYNWEKINGPIPKGMCLWCLDGDTLNCDVANWELISRRDNVIRNSGSLNLKDGYVAFVICGKNSMHLFDEVMKDKKLIEAKRQQILLKRTIDERENHPAKAGKHERQKI